jgi:hypothetical protein
MGLHHITHTDDGEEVVPTNPADWSGWVSASATRNYAIGDPLLDWLNLYGAAAGFERDTQLATFDPRGAAARARRDGVAEQRPRSRWRRVPCASMMHPRRERNARSGSVA